MSDRLDNYMNEHVFLLNWPVSVYFIIIFRELIVFVFFSGVLQNHLVSLEQAQRKLRKLHALEGHKTSVQARKQPVRTPNPVNR